MESSVGFNDVLIFSFIEKVFSGDIIDFTAEFLFDSSQFFGHEFAKLVLVDEGIEAIFNFVGGSVWDLFGDFLPIFSTNSKVFAQEKVLLEGEFDSLLASAGSEDLVSLFEPFGALIVFGKLR